MSAWPCGSLGAKNNDRDPVQQAIGLLHVRLETLRAYHNTAERPGGDLPPGYSTEWDLLLGAYRALCQAVDARDAEEWRELSPYASRGPTA